MSWGCPLLLGQLAPLPPRSLCWWQRRGQAWPSTSLVLDLGHEEAQDWGTGREACGPCHSLSWPSSWPSAVLQTTVRLGVVGSVTGRTQIRMEAWVGPPQPASSNCILFPGAGGAGRKLGRGSSHPRRWGGQDKWEPDCSAWGRPTQLVFWSVTTCVRSFQAEIPRQGWSRSGGGGGKGSGVGGVPKASE